MTDENGNSVRITLNEIWKEQVEQGKKLDSLVQQGTTDSRTAADVEQRLRTVERWVYAIPASVVLGVVSAAVVLLDRAPQ